MSQILWVYLWTGDNKAVVVSKTSSRGCSSFVTSLVQKPLGDLRFTLSCHQRTALITFGTKIQNVVSLGFGSKNYEGIFCQLKMSSSVQNAILPNFNDGIGLTSYFDGNASGELGVLFPLMWRMWVSLSSVS